MSTKNTSSDNQDCTDHGTHARLSTDLRPLLIFKTINDEEKDKEPNESQQEIQPSNSEVNINQNQGVNDDNGAVSIFGAFHEQQSGSQSSNDDEDNGNNNPPRLAQSVSTVDENKQAQNDNDDDAVNQASHGPENKEDEDGGHGLQLEILTNKLSKAMRHFVMKPGGNRMDRLQSMNDSIQSDQGLIQDLLSQIEGLTQDKMEIQSKFDQFQLSVDKAMKDMMVKYQAIKTENNVISDVTTSNMDLKRIKTENERLRRECHKYKSQIDKLKEERDGFASNLNAIQFIINSNKQLSNLNKEQK